MTGRGRNPWIPTLIVLGVVLAAGSRLVVLSAQEHSVRARQNAEGAAARQAEAIRKELDTLARSPRASDQAADAPGRVWLDDSGPVLDAGNASPALVRALLAESQAEGTNVANAQLLGPLRQGSQWIVAVRAPVRVSAGAAPRGATTAIAWRSLDELLARARIGGLAIEGYDFELTQVDARRRTRELLRARTETLDDAVKRTIALPPGLEPSTAGEWTLSLRPQNGWYPLGRLAGEISLLGLVAWLLALFVYDAKRDTRRLHEALAHARVRLDEANDRLVAEIEERLTLQKSLEHARYHDAFTGLPNRRYFMDQLDRALREVRVRRGQRFAVALIDIERFKLITDTLGSPAGDEVMVQAAQRFEKAMAALENVLARWDGQRFAVLLFNVHSRDTAISIATLLHESLRAPFEVRGQRVSVSAHIGVTHVQSGLQRAEDVVREADVALSVARTREGTNVLAYDGAMGGEAVSMVSLEADLHVALARDELRLLYQPIVDLRDNRIVGAEALLRWQHPVEGLLGPEKFLMIAEDTGLVLPITRWVLRHAASVAAEGRRRLPEGEAFYVSVNFSSTALRDPALPDFVREVLQATRQPPQALKLELTETSLIGNPGVAREGLSRFQALGVQLMLDDFGTGYSSLSHLQLFPFDYVKIDRPFAAQPDSGDVQKGITAAIVQMASSLGMHVIAERVESESAVAALQVMGCEFAQGFVFSEPVSGEQMVRRLRSRAVGASDETRSPALENDDDSPTLVVPVMAMEEEHAPRIEEVVIAAAPASARESGDEAVSPGAPIESEPAPAEPEVPAERSGKRSPSDPPTQPLGSPRVVAAQLTKTAAPSDRSPRREEPLGEPEKEKPAGESEESRAAHRRRRQRPG